MDDRCFDAITLRLAAAFNRRRFGESVVGFGIAAGFALAGETEVILGKRKKRRKRRRRGSSRCGSGPCDRCGIAGNPCCTTGGGADDPGTCESGFLCNTDRNCTPCGNAVRQPCCPVPQSSGTCDATDRLVCSFRDGNTCVACGAETEPCCDDGINTGCDSGLFCSPTIPPSGRLFCFPCGAVGQRCCANSSCNGALTCRPNGICASCPGGADDC
jgi:hypothetical protein